MVVTFRTFSSVLYHTERMDFFNIEIVRQLTRAQLQLVAERTGVCATGESEQIIDRLAERHPNGVPMPNNHGQTLTLSALKEQEESHLRAPSPCDSTTSSVDALECVRLLLYPPEDDSDVEPPPSNRGRIDKGKGKARAISRSPSPPPFPEDYQDVPSDDEQGAGSVYTSPLIRLYKGKGKARAVSPWHCSHEFLVAVARDYAEDGPVAGPSNVNQQACSSNKLLSQADTLIPEWDYLKCPSLDKYKTLRDLEPLVRMHLEMAAATRNSAAEVKRSLMVVDNDKKTQLDLIFSLCDTSNIRKNMHALYMPPLKEYPEWRDGTVYMPRERRNERLNLQRARRKEHYQEAQREHFAKRLPSPNRAFFKSYLERGPGGMVEVITPLQSDAEEDVDMEAPDVQENPTMPVTSGNGAAGAAQVSDPPTANGSGTRTQSAPGDDTVSAVNGHVEVDDTQSAANSRPTPRRSERLRAAAQAKEEAADTDADDESVSRAAPKNKRADSAKVKKGGKKRRASAIDFDEGDADANLPKKRVRVGRSLF
ncbi:hypothetical protein JVU11DRAFT_6598 [Chiua virens]|nr:hypothetical protein JVU11DRAFT_6598 [Chiua virens]